MRKQLQIAIYGREGGNIEEIGKFEILAYNTKKEDKLQQYLVFEMRKVKRKEKCDQMFEGNKFLVKLGTEMLKQQKYTLQSLRHKSSLELRESIFKILAPNQAYSQIMRHQSIIERKSTKSYIFQIQNIINLHFFRILVDFYLQSIFIWLIDYSPDLLFHLTKASPKIILQTHIFIQFQQIANIFPHYSKMSTIMTLFRTTNKGIYPMSQLPATTNLSKSFFYMSLGLEIVFLLLFIGIFGLSIFRSVKKIKNPKFKVSKEENTPQEQAQNVEDQTNAKETNDNLIYRFDEEDHQKEKKADDQDQKQEGQEGVQADSEDQYNKEHDQNEQRFLQIDNHLLFLQPFLIGAIVCNNIFATGVISIILIVASVALFFIFNIKGLCSKVKWFSLLFMVPAVGSFAPVFLSDLSLST